uniref:X8 domain-containing protein n=1 Tax=Oryza punctata TaxID=4537 RepID=A0A0E0LMY7_ORYPU
MMEAVVVVVALVLLMSSSLVASGVVLRFYLSVVLFLFFDVSALVHPLIPLSYLVMSKSTRHVLLSSCCSSIAEENNSRTRTKDNWCVCKSDQPQAALQKTIDYACGAGADCNSIHEQGQCFNPNTVVAHCSWAANSYFQRNRAMGATCDFTGTATLTTSDPSVSGCSFPASASAAGTSTTPTMGGTTGTMTPGTFTPGTGMGTTTGTGMGTGTTTGTGLGGLGPTGTSSMDTAAAGLHIRAGLATFCNVLLSLIAFA